MSDIAIKAENIGKMYTIGHQAENGRYVALRDVLMHNARNLWNKTKDLATGKPIIQGDTMEEFWALKDVSFEIHRGEAVGIIGRNGAGKSTLLKVLSRITEPSAGRVTIKGRVASLLEVGTGFHPELSGRENIYLNGTILGMTRVEIKQKFDEIVAFAEVEKYLDTPVKRYSSGMYVRLAFAVAAHLEPEILLVDEVLAVGDAKFQKKCLEKMDDVAQEGRTVIFVSHNIEAIRSLCINAIWLDQGQICKTGETLSVVGKYLTADTDMSGCNVTFSEPERKDVFFREISLMNEDGVLGNVYSPKEGFLVRYNFTCNKSVVGLRLGLRVARSDGLDVFLTTSKDYHPHSGKFSPGNHTVDVLIPKLLLMEGEYLVSVGIGIPNQIQYEFCEHILGFSIDSCPFSMARNIGLLTYPFHWNGISGRE